MSHKIRIHDENGRLITAGFQWTEAVSAAMGFAAICFLGGCLLAGLAGIGKQPDKAAMGLGALIVGIGIISAIIGWKRFSILLHVDGRITCPRGLSYNWFRRNLNERVLEVQLFMTRDEEKSSSDDESTQEVVLVTYEGEITTITSGLDKDEAFLIQRQLTMALEAIFPAVMEAMKLKAEAEKLAAARVAAARR